MKRIVQENGKYAKVHIPAEIQHDLNIQIGDCVDFSIADGKIIITPVHPSAKTNAQVEAQPHINAGEPQCKNIQGNI